VRRRQWDSVTVVCTEHAPAQQEVRTNSGANTLSIALLPVERAEWRFENGPTRRSRILPGTTSIRGARDVIWARWAQTCKCIHVGLSPSLVAKIGSEAGLRAPVLEPREGLHDQTILSCALLLANEMDKDEPSGELLVQSLSNVLAVHVLRNHAGIHAPRLDRHDARLEGLRLKRTLDYIEANLGNALSLDILAQVAASSPFHFARGFKAATGHSPHQYVIYRRIERAKVLLRSTRLPIADVARQVGMSNHSHFAAHFHQLVGCTPRDFRNPV